MGIKGINMVNLVPQILKLEDIAISAEGQQRADAISKIESLTRTAVHQGTASYGLRVLSRFGYSENQLLKMAQCYNLEGQRFGILLGHPYDIDPPHLHFFYMQNGLNFKKVNID